MKYTFVWRHGFITDFFFQFIAFYYTDSTSCYCICTFVQLTYTSYHWFCILLQCLSFITFRGINHAKPPPTSTDAYTKTVKNTRLVVRSCKQAKRKESQTNCIILMLGNLFLVLVFAFVFRCRHISPFANTHFRVCLIFFLSDYDVRN